MSIKDFQQKVKSNEGYILSDGTLNLQHLLPKAYDLLLELNEGKELREEILSVFILENEDYDKNESLFVEQYYGLAHVNEQKQIEANDIWNEDVFNMFSEMSPQGYYFGSSHGDGACIGWFKDYICYECGLESIEDLDENGLCEECSEEITE